MLQLHRLESMKKGKKKKKIELCKFCLIFFSLDRDTDRPPLHHPHAANLTVRFKQLTGTQQAAAANISPKGSFIN